MLCEITIENVAVIEKATLRLGEGFTVLTGETGAGKSIVIDSINVIMGNRTSRDIVRSGAEKAAIWASFQQISTPVREQLRGAGYDAEDELLLYREVSAEGKSSCRINGAPATAAMLREVCGRLVNIHGQHDNQNLLNPARHIDMLDAFAQNEALLAQYQEAYHVLLAVRREREALTMDDAEKNRRLDLLRYETGEIEAAALQAGEEEQLLERREMVRNSQRIVQAMGNAYAALSGDDENSGAAQLLADAVREMEAVSPYAAELASLAETLNENYYIVQEAASDLQNRLSAFAFDEGDLEQLEERLDVIYRLKQKYGASVEQVLEYGEKAQQELAAIEFSAERLAQLQDEEQKATRHTAEWADKLSESRSEAFSKLQKQIAGALEFLNMPGIRMALHRQETAFTPKGRDEIEFYLSANPGEDPRPLSKIASGGELARIMLALKNALAERDDTPTVIYDEIDTGISGLAAGRVGQLLRDTAAGRQVICVTHTAQIAAFAQSHLVIEKQVQDGRTFTHVRALDRPGRIDELARIVSGDRVTETARANAEEMLQLAKE